MGVSDQNRPLLYIKFIWPHHRKFRILSVSTQKSVFLTRIPAVSEDGGWGLYLLLRTLVRSKLNIWEATCQDAVCCQSCWGGRFLGFGGFPLAAPWNPLGGLLSDKWLPPLSPLGDAGFRGLACSVGIWVFRWFRCAARAGTATLNGMTNCPRLL